jgi:hypothetical protein
VRLPPKLGTVVDAGAFGEVLGDGVLGDVVVPGSDSVEGDDGLVRPVEVGDGGVRLPPGIVELPVPLGP